MKKNKKSTEEEKPVVQQPVGDEAEIDDDGIEVNDPGDCIGHWAECEECEICEIQDSCEAMTKNINGEVGNAEEK